jgi:hypothetical protein
MSELAYAEIVGAGRQVTPNTHKNLARMLMEVADYVQASLREDHCVDRMAGSHSRARDAVKCALLAHPVPWRRRGTEGWEESLEEWRERRIAWQTSLAADAISVLQVADDLHRQHYPPVNDFRRPV